MKVENMPQEFWNDWKLAIAAIKGERKLTKHTLERWARDVEAWKREHEGEEHT